MGLNTEGSGVTGGRAAEPGCGRADKPAGTPIVSIILMAVFLVGGAIGLVADWPAGPANLDWGVWVVVYGGYGFVISAALYHALTGR